MEIIQEVEHMLCHEVLGCLSTEIGISSSGVQHRRCWTCNGRSGLDLVRIIMVVLLLLYTTSIHGFVDGSMVGGGACCTLRGDIGTGWYCFTLEGCTTGSTIRAGVSVHVSIVYNGIGVNTWVNIGGNGNMGKRSWYLLCCNICDILLKAFFVAYT